MKKIILVLVCIALYVFANAQVTTSEISGKIEDTNGAPLPGATIMAVHEPTGTKYGITTNGEGRFSLQGMRTGGPYKVEISFIGYSKETYSDIYLRLGETYPLNVKLKESSVDVEEVKVVGQSNFTSQKTGAATNFSNAQIENTPSVNRSIYDIAKLDPLVSTSKLGGISIAGTNNRYNSFQIDGMVSNDVFGLAGTGTNGGQTGANPILLDAVEEIQIVVAPFDVRQSGFTGGGINAVTKSGTNEFKGSIYGFYTNQNMYGKYNQVSEKDEDLTEQSTKTLGFTVGGPIVKDKLFFFAGGEYVYNTTPSSYYPGYSESYISEAEAKAIADRYYDITGNQDSYGERNINKKGISAIARIDWNINEKNKLALRYQLNNSSQDVYSSSSSYYYFANSAYTITNKTNSFVAELNSNINNQLHNEARAGLTIVRDNRDIDNSGPTIQIDNLGGTYDATTGWSEGTTTAYIGTEYSSGANSLDQDIYTLEDNLSWYKGNHTLTFGTHNEVYNMSNLFIQAANGAYYYNSLNDFIADSAWKFVYNYSDYDLTGTYNWQSEVKAGQFALYAQDKWNVSNELTITYGLRIDVPVFLNEPSTNSTFNSSDYASAFDIKTGEVPSSKIMLSPRLGFRWYANDDHSTLVRGGAGLFTGRVPFVWMSNVYSNTGVEMKGTTITSNVPSFETYGNDPVAAMNSASGSSTNPTINTVSKDFKFPQTFRANLALEQKFLGDIKLTIEGLFSKTYNNVFFKNLALENEGKKVYAVSSDDEASAATYYTNNSGDYYAIVNLENTNKGYSYNLTAKLEKSFESGLDLMGSYTFGHSYAVNDGTSSVAYSNWKYNYSLDPNDKNEVGFSKFDIPNRIVLQVAYTTPKYANGMLATIVALIYNGSNGMRYSLTMSESKDFNGDGYKGNSLLYIPTESELAKMTFATEEDRTSFGNWIKDDSYASENRGQYADRNSNCSPWENHFDFHIAEDFYYLKEKGSKISLTFDIINVANMLNKEWGSYYVSDYNVTPLKVTALTADTDGNMTPTYSYVDDKVAKSNTESRWHAQIGLKVTF